MIYISCSIFNISGDRIYARLLLQQIREHPRSEGRSRSIRELETIWLHNISIARRCQQHSETKTILLVGKADQCGSCN